MRITALLPSLLFLATFATGCLHEPAGDFSADAYPRAEETAAEPVVRREVTLVWDGASAQVDVLPASPKDRPPPDPIPFRIGAAHGALGHVDLSDCRDQGLPAGYLKMRVTFRRDGRVSHASVEGPTPPSQDALDCIAAQLEGALVPRFDGREATLSKSLFVEPGEGSLEPGDTVVRRGGAPSRRPLTRTDPPISALTKPLPR